MKSSTVVLLLGAAVLSNGLAIKRDQMADLLDGNASGNWVGLSGLLSGNGNSNGNGNAAGNDNVDCNEVDGNNVLSGLDLANGNSASADGNSAGLSIGRRDVVLLPPSPMDDVAKAISSIAADNGSSDQVDMSKLLSYIGNGNGNSNTVASGNGDDNTVSDNNVLSGIDILNGNSASVSNNSADAKIYILPITMNQCDSYQ